MIVTSMALREKKEGVDIREVLVTMGLRGRPETLVLRGQEEDKACQD